MRLLTIEEALGANTYPGRGLLAGLTPDGKNAVLAYFIMGRSVNSRNRIFVPIEGGIRTQAFDPSKLTDPSLIIYNAVRTLDGYVIATNGDQTDTVYDGLCTGRTFTAALRTRTFEPDGPNWTPRISALLRVGEQYAYKLSILKSAGGNSASCERFTYHYDEPVAGEGRLIHTYEHDGSPIPSFEGDPRAVSLPDSLTELTESLWASLDADNKVSLFTAFYPLAGGAAHTKIVNKNK